MRDLIFNNFWIKVCSLLLAIMIWHVVNTWQQGGQFRSPGVAPAAERAFNRMPITVMKSADNERGFRVEPSRVDVLLRGAPDVVNKLSVRDVQVFIDLTDVSDASNLLKRVQVHHPPGLTVSRVTPAEVRVQPSGN